ELRDETKMLFISGVATKDPTDAGKAGAMYYYDKILQAKPRTKSLKPLQQTFIRDIPKTSLAGAALLGNNEKFGTEKMIKEFMADVDKERKNRASFTRGYTKPLPIDAPSFGITYP
ncbi:MAG: hypothetical protein ACRCZF_16415, partial [Gemmataceae bacterium]